MFTKSDIRTTARFAAAAGLAATMLGLTACGAQSAGKPAALNAPKAPASASASAPASAPATPAVAVAVAAAQTSATANAAKPAATEPAPNVASAPSHGWLTPAQLPFDSTLHWTGGTGSDIQTGTAALASQSIIYPCVDNGYSAVTSHIAGFKMDQFFSGDGTGFDKTSMATQSYLTFTSAAAAQNAYQAIKQDLAICTARGIGSVSANTNRPMTTPETGTASTADSLAYTYFLRDDQGTPAQVEGNYGEDSDYHAYIAINGATIEILWLRGGTAIDNGSNDAAVLHTLATTLN